MVDVARMMSYAYRRLNEQPRGASAPVVIKMDIEGSEYEVSPHLIRAGVLCRVRFIFYEDHVVPSRSDLNVTTKEGVEIWLSRTREQLRARCGDEHERVLRLDDEYHRYDGKVPLPLSGPGRCDRSHHVRSVPRPEEVSVEDLGWR